ncbi:MAG TPA: DUF5679 domain-containing protein [Chthonomonadaceae bacterium]|nr:DUF5679 domain-containing protein [Chthonomonadaceae bacterium]
MNAAQNGHSPDADLVVLGYCVHCRSRRPMQGAIQVCNRRGGRDLKGHCAVCGKSMYRLGGWDSVAAAAQDAQATAVVKTIVTPPVVQNPVGE